MAIWIAALAACKDPSDPAVTVPLTPEVTFPDEANGAVPLDVVDGLPVRVKVSVTTPVLRDATGLTAHVWISEGTGAALPVSGVMTDISTVALQPTVATESTTTYTGTATLNAPWPPTSEPVADGLESVAVMAEVDGSVGSGTTKITAPVVMVSAPAVSPLWSGSGPRYDVCIETSASKGAIDLTADDPSVLGPQSGAGTLVTGPCLQPMVSGGPAVSHTNFVLTYSPSSYAVVATLRGKPPGVVAGWTASITTPSSPGPVVKLTLGASPTRVATAGGVLETFTVSASLPGSEAVVGLPISFSTGAGGPAFSPAQLSTGSDGTAVSTVLVPYGGELVITATSAGGGFATLPPIEQPAVALSVAATAVTAEPLAAGATVSVTATATAQTPTSDPVPGIPITFAASGLSFAPGSATTDADGQATATVFVSYSAAPVTANISGGGAGQVISLSSALPPLSIGLPVATLTGIPHLYQVQAPVTANVGGVDLPVSGLTVAFGAGGMGGNSNPFAPASVTTDAHGLATSYAVIMILTPIVAEVTAAGQTSQAILP
ncbi:MAG TPA: Ig-like domain-containing protein [Kofleriaceae bacterium]|nr:Ig-like domain-containing protein [Kofleriaceae bacterium]